LRASLIERYLGSGSSRRSSPCWYVSSPAPGGGSRLRYVKKDDLARVREQVEAWRGHRAALARLREIADEVLAILREIAKASEATSP
jgi:hypothetical protein